MLAGTALAAGLAEPAGAQQPAAPAPEAEPFVTLTGLEAAFIVAAVDTMIPADELSPSGSECGVADLHRPPAWRAPGAPAPKCIAPGRSIKGTPEQGYQLPLTPREFFAAGVQAANAWSHKTYGKSSTA